MLPYSKPPIDDQKPVKKPVKKSKNKNVNHSNIADQLYDPYLIPYEENPKEYSPNAKNVIFSKKDDYIDLTEEEAEMLFATFVNEDQKQQGMIELEKDVNEMTLNSEMDGDFENMRICQDSAETFLPDQALYYNSIKFLLLFPKVMMRKSLMSTFDMIWTSSKQFKLKSLKL